MLIIRYPNGQAVQYNQANYLVYGNDHWVIYDRKGGTWIASFQISAGITVEAEPACSVSNPLKANLNKISRLQNHLAYKEETITHLNRVIRGLRGAKKKK